MVPRELPDTSKEAYLAFLESVFQGKPWESSKGIPSYQEWIEQVLEGHERKAG